MNIIIIRSGRSCSKRNRGFFFFVLYLVYCGLSLFSFSFFGFFGVFRITDVLLRLAFGLVARLRRRLLRLFALLLGLGF